MIKPIDRPLLDRVSAQAKQSPRLRMNHNFHDRLDDPINRLLNAVEPGTYLPPHRHPSKMEVLLLLRGTAGVVFFDDRGEVCDTLLLDPLQGSYGVEFAPGVWHALVVLSPDSVLYEVKTGPYEPITPEDILPWAPAPDDAEGVALYIARLTALFQ